MVNWNDFKGRAKRIEDIDLPRIGHKIGVGEDEIHAILDVESRGKGFDSQGRPIILFERHWFYRFLSGEDRAKAVREGLAVSKWSRATYNKDQYSLLKRAMAINETAALKSASWGLGQVMGFNHSLAGYDTVQDFVLAMMDDEDNHLEAMVNFIINAGLDDEIRRHDWAGFAKGYNGKGYKANKYDTRLAAAYRRWAKIKDTPWSPTDATEEEDASHQEELPLEEPEKPSSEVSDISGTDLPEEKESSPEPSVKPSTTMSEIVVALLKAIFRRV